MSNFELKKKERKEEAVSILSSPSFPSIQRRMPSFYFKKKGKKKNMIKNLLLYKKNSYFQIKLINNNCCGNNNTVIKLKMDKIITLSIFRRNLNTGTSTILALN